ncbi:hypothetical protein GQ54DRAFT_295253 [Martensiomyces pterosporus]|nr:hypothetical protein GQ54DRAFT_295253 [Martensiomyces pterosporus]
MIALQQAPSPTSFMAQTAATPNSGRPAYNTICDPQLQQQPHALAIYLSNSIRRDVRILAALGAIKETSANLIFSYLPHATTTINDEEVAILQALTCGAASPTPDSTIAVRPPGKSPAAAADAIANSASTVKPASPAAEYLSKDMNVRHIASLPKKSPRQRSETAPLRLIQAASQPYQQQQQQQQRGCGSPPRKDKAQKYEGLGAKIGALFGKFSQDSETSPKPRSVRSNTSVASPLLSPRLKSNKNMPLPAKSAGGTDRKQPDATTLASLAAEEELKLHRLSQQDSSFKSSPRLPLAARGSANQLNPAIEKVESRGGCNELPLGIAARRAVEVTETDAQKFRIPSQGSQHSSTSSNESVSTATIAEYSTHSSDTSSIASGRNTSSSTASIKSSKAWRDVQMALLHDHQPSSVPSSAASSATNSAASTLANRKRSYTHLGLSMESFVTADQHPLPTSTAPSPALSQASSTTRTPQLRRSKPSPNLARFEVKYSGTGTMTEGTSRFTAPTNSLGLMLQSSSASPGPSRSKPLPTPIRAQRHHNSFSVASREPKSPAGRVHGGGLSSIVHSRYAAPAPKPAATGSIVFPSMPTEASQRAMMSASLGSMQQALLKDPAELQAGAQSAPSLPIVALDRKSAGQPLMATAIYNYSSSIKGDLEFAKGDRIAVQSKVNDDWWFGSVVAKHDEYGITAKRTGMFPRSHVALAYQH